MQRIYLSPVASIVHQVKDPFAVEDAAIEGLPLFQSGVGRDLMAVAGDYMLECLFERERLGR
jgi:hypothetical protein